jgi:uncharacterized protein YegP (UPF0339 family)
MSTIFVYRSPEDQQWRWRFIASNGRIIADSGEGYVSEYNATRAAQRMLELAASALVVRHPSGERLNTAFNPHHGPDPF